MGSAGEPGSGILRYVFVDSITVLIFLHRHSLRPVRLLYLKILVKDFIVIGTCVKGYSDNGCFFNIIPR